MSDQATSEQPEADPAPAPDPDAPIHPAGEHDSGDGGPVGIDHDGHKLAEVLTEVFGSIYAQSVYIGAGSTHSPEPPRRRDGKIDLADLGRELRHYMPPSCYDSALRALAEDHVLVLHGNRGLGKRTGALHLLRDLTDKQLVALSPAITLKELAAHRYTPGFGYLVLDHVDERESVETEFVWRTVRERVRDSSSYLVLTRISAGRRYETVRQVPWERPDLRRVLLAHLAETSVDGEVVETILKGTPDGCSIAEVVDVAQRVAAGEDPAQALSGYTAAATEEVRTWFERDHRSRREVLHVAALAFIEGAGDRAFESAAGRLGEIMAGYFPVPEPAEESDTPAPDAIPQWRQERTGDDALMTVRRSEAEPAARREVVFAKPGYRRRVLAELYLRYDARFWDGLREWIWEIALTGSLAPTWGLALLAAEDSYEVEASYLRPWSDGDSGWRGQIAATHVVWWMCFDEVTAPLALRIAKNWASHGSSAQRWTAAAAFGGVLGMFYPAEAMRRLWHLATQSAGGEFYACVALAALFAGLTDHSEAAGSVVTMLDRQIEQVATRPNTRLQTLTAFTALEMVCARGSDRAHPSIAIFTRRHPDRIDAVARIWASALRHRRCRRRALLALLDALDSLQHISDNPTADARALGAALARALPPEEHDPLQRDLTTMHAMRHRHRPADRDDALGRILLAVIERLHQRQTRNQRQTRKGPQ